MYQIRHFVIFFQLLILAAGNNSTEDGEARDLLADSGESPIGQNIRSPMVEVLMHLPANFQNIRSLKESLGLTSERIKRKTERNLSGEKTSGSRSLVDVRTYEISRAAGNRRTKRETETIAETPILEKPEPEKLVSSLVGSGFGEYSSSNTEPILPVPDAIRGPIYTTYPVKEFDIIDIDETDDGRRRRNDSFDGRDEGQRDKRTFQEGGENGETTTALPFWKRKKENPPFVTGRGSSAQKANTYTPPQHRTAENARESHSIKNLDKTVQSNEINRSNQDNYYASTNRRTYSRQSSDPVGVSTPKSVYDTIDYSKRNQDGGRGGFGRSHEDKKETLRDGRVTHEPYHSRPFQYYPAPVDRHFYQPNYPYPTEVIGRGVEYYHRTYDPTTGRIIYYANMPEQGRTYDYRFVDPISRNFYVNRPYMYDPYYRNYVPPYDYRFPHFGRSIDYMRTGRSSSQAYSYPYQEREKFPRDARFNGPFNKDTRLKQDELRNKTYVIYDAEESRNQFQRPTYSAEANRLNYPTAPNNLPVSQVPFRQYSFPPPLNYFPPEPFPYRNNFYPSFPGIPSWGPSQPRSGPDSRQFSPPEVQLPLTTSNRSLQPTRDTDPKKSS